MYDLQIKQRNYKKYAIVAGCLMAFGMLWSFFIFPTTVVAVLKNVRFLCELARAHIPCSTFHLICSNFD